MAASQSKIVLLFEDDEKHAEKLGARIKIRLPKAFTFVRFSSVDSGETGAHEDRLLFELKKSKYRQTALIVCDRDLSLTVGYRGLSEAVVSKVANNLGIPICLYAKGLADSVLERQKTWGDGRIVLDCSEPDDMAVKVAILARGFGEVAAGLKTALSNRKAPLHSPAAVVATMLGAPMTADKIALYASGDQKMVAEVLPFAQSDTKGLTPRLPMLVGYWLYDSILRFPGLVVNQVAAASYLNIAVDSFAKDAIQSLFKTARYKGPFSDASDPLWWRHLLDDLISEANGSGLEYAVKKTGNKKLKPCLCSVDQTSRAGWYCMATKLPVSLENSKGNITWFPRGADLARIRNDVYDEIGPWLGLY